MNGVRREATAYHEAGHAVMCWLEALPLSSVTIISDTCKNSDGCCWHRNIIGRRQPDMTRSKGVQTRLEKLTRIALAGGAAQRRFNAKSCRPHHSAQDIQNASNLMSHVCQTARELDARLALHQIEVEQALGIHWNLVEAVARALLEKKTMIGWEIEVTIGAAYRSPPVGRGATVSASR